MMQLGVFSVVRLQVSTRVFRFPNQQHIYIYDKPSLYQANLLQAMAKATPCQFDRYMPKYVDHKTGN